MSTEGAAQIRFVFCAGPSGLGYLQFIPRADARGYSLPALRAWIQLNFVMRLKWLSFELHGAMGISIGIGVATALAIVLC